MNVVIICLMISILKRKNMKIILVEENVLQPERAKFTTKRNRKNKKNEVLGQNHVFPAGKSVRAFKCVIKHENTENNCWPQKMYLHHKFEESWVKYHKQNAILQMLCNGSQPKYK